MRTWAPTGTAYVRAIRPPICVRGGTTSPISAFVSVVGRDYFTCGPTTDTNGRANCAGADVGGAH